MTTELNEAFLARGAQRYETDQEFRDRVEAMRKSVIFPEPDEPDEPDEPAPELSRGEQQAACHIQRELDKLAVHPTWHTAVILWELAIYAAETAHTACSEVDAEEPTRGSSATSILREKMAAIASHRAILDLGEARSFAEFCQNRVTG